MLISHRIILHRRLSLTICIIAFLFFPRLSHAQISQILVIDSQADISESLTTWPSNVVPIFPGAKPVEYSSCLDPNFCKNPLIQVNPNPESTIQIHYLLEVAGTDPETVDSWHKQQLNSLGWTYTTTTSTGPDASAAHYEKCWSQNGVLQIAISNYVRSDKKTMLTLVLTKFNPGFQEPERCLPMSNQNNFEGAAQSTTAPGGAAQCSLSGIEKTQAAEMKSEIKNQFNIGICESNLCSPVSQNLEHEVSAWTPTQLSSTQSILEQLGNSCFLEKLPVKSVCKASAGKEEDKCNSESDSPSAYYSVENNRVVLCYDRWSIKDDKKRKNGFIGEDEQLLSQLLAHELGHAYWRNDDGSLNFDKIADWLINTGYVDCTNPIDCWGVALGGFINPPSDAPSEYAQTSPPEDFAESVRFYVTQPEKLLSRSALRYKYLRDQVFCGKEYQTMEVDK